MLRSSAGPMVVWCKGWQAVLCQTLAPIALFHSRRQSVTGLALSADDRTAYSVAKDGSVFQLDVETFKRWVAPIRKCSGAGAWQSFAGACTKGCCSRRAAAFLILLAHLVSSCSLGDMASASQAVLPILSVK